MVYHILSVLFLLFVWCPCMAINVVSLQYNGGLLPDGIFPLLRHLAPLQIRTTILSSLRRRGGVQRLINRQLVKTTETPYPRDDKVFGV